ncbi:hypothetical protein HKBW3S43_01340 [Candidatus Hakubella thermalkaliphila]|uniref:Ubiquitin Mut7-C domain-containing protein n=1 Tax=Candidatus Hakubella thermalkaliphila TaxID=2754717 RepID=A0A6V8P592_9ACTN|nr:MoaD/ThiS family protein [Candidatus Hakubella thermalkaliphila]GFP27809.1 hypothetical protein HKBW3S33_01219 [Candidatus Hakubella thermalkaliphila]GFP35549.1 hypothetical protein HKBW3S43_01340 [Candidatus Hakubella thermalkaliphila]
MLEVRLYGELRRYAEDRRVASESILLVPVQDGDTVEDVVRRIGIEPEDISNIFLNGRYSACALTLRVKEGDRLGIFPRNMGLLYI